MKMLQAKDREDTHTILLCVIMLLAAWVRLTGIGDKSMGFDEVISLEYSTALGGYDRFVTGVVMESPPDLTRLQSARPWWMIWASLTHHLHPPLYSLGLRLWRCVFGESDIAARSLSTVCSLIAILLLFSIIQMLYGPTIALYASLFMAVAVPQVVYAQQACNYTMAIALALGSCLTLLRLQAYGVSLLRVFGLTLGLLCLLLTHYLAFPVVAALGLYALSAFRQERRWWAVGAFAMACLLFLLFWGPFFAAQWPSFRAQALWLTDPLPGHVIRTFRLLAVFPIRAFLGMPSFVALVSTPLLFSITLVGACCLLPLALRDHRRGVWLWTLWTIFSLAFLAMHDLRCSTRLLAMTRYSLLATPGAYVLSALVLSRLRAIWRWGLLASFVLASLWGAPRAVAKVQPTNWRDIAAYLDRVVSPEDALVYKSRTTDPRTYYRRLFSGVSYYMKRKLPTLLIASEKPLAQQTLDRLKASPTCWLVTPSLDQQARELLAGFTIQDRQTFGIRDEVYRMRWTGE